MLGYLSETCIFLYFRVFIAANRDRHFGSGNFHERLMSLLEEKYGKELVTESDDGVSITISVDGTIAVIDLETLVCLHWPT